MAKAAPANIITNQVSLLLREGPVYPETISNLEAANRSPSQILS
jgi:hypothetical protein